jgi:hypothetical protein
LLGTTGDALDADNASMGQDMTNESQRTKLDRFATSIPKHEFEFLMKIGKLNRQEVLALIEKYDGNREKIYRDLAWQRASRS